MCTSVSSVPSFCCHVMSLTISVTASPSPVAGLVPSDVMAGLSLIWPNAIFTQPSPSEYTTSRAPSLLTSTIFMRSTPFPGSLASDTAVDVTEVSRRRTAVEHAAAWPASGYSMLYTMSS